MTATIIYILLAAAAFGLGVYLGYRIGTVPRSVQGDAVPYEHTDLFI